MELYTLIEIQFNFSFKNKKRFMYYKDKNV